MNCPVCNKNLAPTLSICPSCGAMMNDSVREELNLKITSAPRPPGTSAPAEHRPVAQPPVIDREMAATINRSMTPAVRVSSPLTPPPTMAAPIAAETTAPAFSAVIHSGSLAVRVREIETPAPAAVRSAPAKDPKPDTTEIASKATSPTLVEFQNKNSNVPEWRLQLQNAVRKRVDNVRQTSVVTAESVPTPVGKVSLPTTGSAALKAEFVEENVPATSANPKLANALRRIEQSRRKFMTAGESPAAETVSAPPVEDAAPQIQAKQYPFYIATKNAEILPKPAAQRDSSANAGATQLQAAVPAPIIERLPVIEKAPVMEQIPAFVPGPPPTELPAPDTNKLRPLPNAAVISEGIERVSGELPGMTAEADKLPHIRITRVRAEDEEFSSDFDENDEFENGDDFSDDAAPIAMRFNAGLFDLIIGGFSALLLLAPFMLSGGSWFSLTGFLAFLVTSALVMFIYMTTAVGLFGKTIGMKIFALETIDIEENDYPTFHQAAVSSSVYLVSLALGGIGFLPALFNTDRRTAPDLLSGTVIVREE